MLIYIDPQSVLDCLMKSHDCTAFLETIEEMERLYKMAALKGCSEAPPAEAEVDHHYISLVKRSSRLYMLDGDMEGPVVKGNLNGDEDLLGQLGFDAIQEYIQSDRNGAFSLLALVES